MSLTVMSLKSEAAATGIWAGEGITMVGAEDADIITDGAAGATAVGVRDLFSRRYCFDSSLDGSCDGYPDFDMVVTDLHVPC